MHTKVIVRMPRGARLHHNSDWSGHAILTWDGAHVGDPSEARIPGWLAQRLLAFADNYYGEEERTDEHTPPTVKP